LTIVNSAAINMCAGALVVSWVTFLGSTSLGVVLLDHMADLCSLFFRSFILFSKVVVLGYIPTSHAWGFLFLYPCQHLVVVVFLMVAILKGVRWNVSIVLICISFMVKNGEHFFMFFTDLQFFFWKGSV
jgi:hypothetical protein